jgi:hypothetical protein
MGIGGWNFGFEEERREMRRKKEQDRWLWSG